MNWLREWSSRRKWARLDRTSEVREICEKVKTLEGAEREACIDAACAGDEALRLLVDSVLEHEEAYRRDEP